MLALVARRLKLSYNVLNLRNFHCKPSEQCQSLNHNNDESENTKSVVSKRVGARYEWNLRGQNPKINFDGSDRYKKILSHSLSDQCLWKSLNFNHNNQLISTVSPQFSTTCEQYSLVSNQNNNGKDETKTVILSGIGDGCDWKTSNPYAKNQCILKRYGKQKKRKHCNCEFLRYHWDILKWTTGVLGSFYASKLMCLYARRRRNNREWQLMERALAERQKIQKDVLEKQYGISKFQRSHVPADKHTFDWSENAASFSYQPILVTNEHDLKQQNRVTIGTQTTTDPLHVDKLIPYTNLRAAVQDFESKLGHCEFKLGIQSLKMDRPEVAISHFMMASVHNHPEATYNLGVCYEMGIGTNMNLNSAMKFYRAAANLGHPKSMYNLGVFYAKGIGGLKKDREAAKQLLEEASRMGFKQATAALRRKRFRMRKNTSTYDASQILTNKTHLITSELSPVHRADWSIYKDVTKKKQRLSHAVQIKLNDSILGKIKCQSKMTPIECDYALQIVNSIKFFNCFEFVCVIKMSET